MNNKLKFLSTPAILFSILAIIFAVASFLTLTKSYSGIASKVIFWGSIVTTLAAIIVPLLSLKKLKLDSYKIKLYSLYFGIVGLLLLLLLDSYGLSMMIELKSFADKGLIWGLNTALLLFNLTYLEIENNDLKNQEIIKFNLEKEEELRIEKEQKAIEIQKRIESQRDVLRLQRENLNLKQKINSKGEKQ
ncbi:hypothetical protein [Priestia megaterium]|uniref:hypothetical protein n=1 Tax=Priestia megaterium TaxID=1404 RepID=UPI000BFD2138|nr:hypothetical protein [Priestia megaterium]PGO53737.1 hypothetical protein CN981_21345 [Priestia megaterium]